MSQFQEVWRKDEFEEEWKRIGKTFKGIEIYGLPVNAVGELIPRYFMAKNTFDSDETLRIFIPDTETGRLSFYYRQTSWRQHRQMDALFPSALSSPRLFESLHP